MQSGPYNVDHGLAGQFYVGGRVWIRRAVRTVGLAELQGFHSVIHSATSHAKCRALCLAGDLPRGQRHPDGYCT